MEISAAALKRAGLHVEPETFDQLVAEALETVVPLHPPPDATAELSDDELALLREGGMRFDPLPSGAEHPLIRTAAHYAALLGSSLSVAEAAAQLGVAESRVRQRLGERTLYGIKQSGGWRLPRFQFIAGGVQRHARRGAQRGQPDAGNSLVPGIERVLPRLPADLHPLAVLGWFTTPHPDLVVNTEDGEERPVSPLDWLNAGLSPEVVANLADDAVTFA